VVFFLIGAVAIGGAVEVSGLAARAARFLGRLARSSPARLYVQMIVSLPAFAVLVPSAITRNAILIPAYQDALDRMGIRKTDHSGRMLMLAARQCLLLTQSGHDRLTARQSRPPSRGVVTASRSADDIEGEKS
jgi:di/tricarboxylate transporter